MTFSVKTNPDRTFSAMLGLFYLVKIRFQPTPTLTWPDGCGRPASSTFNQIFKVV